MRQADALEPQRLNTRGVAGGCRRRDLAEDVGLLLEERVELVEPGSMGLRRRERAQLRKSLLREAGRCLAPRRRDLEFRPVALRPVELRYGSIAPVGRRLADRISLGDVLRPRQLALRVRELGAGK